MVTAMNTQDDEYAGGPSRLIHPATIRELSQLNPAMSVGHLVLEWTLIVLIAVVAWRYLNAVTYAVAVVLIGARQHSLIVLMHEGAHYRLLPNRAWNDRVAELFTAFPFFLFTMRDYRRNHFPHHRYLNTERDPDWVRKKGRIWTFPQSRVALAGLLVRDLVGFGFAQFLLATLKLPRRRSDELAFSVARCAFNVLIPVMFASSGLAVPFLLFWVVPMVTWMQVAFHIRSIAEHLGIQRAPGPFSHTRTVLATRLDRLLLGCKNVNFHLEHHLYPGVPFYRLPKLHALLMAQPAYREQAPITQGYLGVLRECSEERQLGEEHLRAVGS